MQKWVNKRRASPEGQHVALGVQRSVPKPDFFTNQLYDLERLCQTPNISISPLVKKRDDESIRFIGLMMMMLNNVCREVSTILLNPRAALHAHFVPSPLLGIKRTIMQVRILKEELHRRSRTDYENWHNYPPICVYSQPNHRGWEALSPTSRSKMNNCVQRSKEQESGIHVVLYGNPHSAFPGMIPSFPKHTDLHR